LIAIHCSSVRSTLTFDQKTDPPSIPSGGSIGRVAVAVAVAVNVKVNASRRLWDAF